MGGVGTIVWLDVLMIQAAAALTFDYLLLWATGQVARVPTTGRRLLLASLLGTAYFVAWQLAQGGVLPHYGIIRQVPVVVLVSGLMLVAAFGRMSPRRLLTVGAAFYGIGFVSAGAGTAASFLFGSAADPDSVAGFLAGGGTVLLVAELGWGVVQRRLWRYLYHLPIEIRFDGHSRRVTALVDTGNRLRDPLSGLPVVVIEHAALEPLLPSYLQAAVEQMEAGDLSGVTRLLASERWSTRFRVIPFSSIGKQHGLLIGFRPDAVHFLVADRVVAAADCVLAIYKGSLDPDGAYQALIHPDLVQDALGAPADEATSHDYPSGRRRTGEVAWR